MPAHNSAPPGNHCRQRLFEWTASIALIGMAVILIGWPRAINGSKFQFMLDVVGSFTLMMVYLVVGCFRVIALYLNGNWPVWGAVVRSAGAICGALVWMQMALSLIIAQKAEAGLPPPSVPVYLALVGAELYSAYRAASDARYR